MLKFRQFSYYHRYLQWLQKSHTLIAGNKYWKLVIWLLNYVIVFICAGCNGIFLYCPCCPIVKLLSESNNTLSAPKRRYIYLHHIKNSHCIESVIFFAAKPFLCDQCEKPFAKQSDLKNHFRVHSGEKPHSCSLCISSFSKSSTLNKHFKVHTREKPFMCSVWANLLLHWQNKRSTSQFTLPRFFYCFMYKSVNYGHLNVKLLLLYISFYIHLL
jgi:hypothetical protein